MKKISGQYQVKKINIKGSTYLTLAENVPVCEEKVEARVNVVK